VQTVSTCYRIYFALKSINSGAIDKEFKFILKINHFLADLILLFNALMPVRFLSQMPAADVLMEKALQTILYT